MGLFKTIKAMLPPDELKVQRLDNLLRDIADDNEAFNNLLVEYGIKHFVKKWDEQQHRKWQ